jgi:hypothetical protein
MLLPASQLVTGLRPDHPSAAFEWRKAIAIGPSSLPPETSKLAKASAHVVT